MTREQGEAPELLAYYTTLTAVLRNQHNEPHMTAVRVVWERDAGGFI
jgi:hypothetical protein